MISSSSEIEWNCPECQTAITDRRKYCNSCQSMLVGTCVPSGKSGLYNNYHRHRNRCNYCTPELEEERKQLKMENRISRFQEIAISDNGKKYLCLVSVLTSSLMCVCLEHMVTKHRNFSSDFIL